MAAPDATAEEDTTDNVTQEHHNNNTTHATGHLPQPQPPTSPPSISDLINDLPTTPQPDPFSNLHSSKHNPDFRIRNQHKALKLATILSDLQLQLFAAQRSQDQKTFDALYQRICKAGEGLESLAGEVEEGKGGNGIGEGGFMRVDWKEDRWFVEHGGRVEEGERHDDLSGERVRRARGEYEERLKRVEEGCKEENGDGDEAEDQHVDDDGDEIGEDGGVAVGEGAHEKNLDVKLLAENGYIC